MRKTKSSFYRAMNDILLYDETEYPLIGRLCNTVYDGIISLCVYMSKTMRARVLDIADAVTTLVLYRLYNVNGQENEKYALRYVSQFKCVRVLAENLCECLSIHDLADEILIKVENTGKPLFNFINKNY